MRTERVIQTPKVTKGVVKSSAQHTRAVFILSEQPLKLQAWGPDLQPPGEHRK